MVKLKLIACKTGLLKIACHQATIGGKLGPFSRVSGLNENPAGNHGQRIKTQTIIGPQSQFLAYIEE
jgi:hypothetical protein